MSGRAVYAVFRPRLRLRCDPLPAYERRLE